MVYQILYEKRPAVTKVYLKVRKIPNVKDSDVEEEILNWDTMDYKTLFEQAKALLTRA